MRPPDDPLRDLEQRAVREAGVGERALGAAMPSAASVRERSMPNSDGYVGLLAAASLPAVLPSSFDAPSTSRMSSTIWNTRPRSVAYRSIASTCRSSPPAMIAPATAAARIRAPVLRACMSWSAGRRARAACARESASVPADSRSIAWPPTIPTTPAASAMRASTRRRLPARHRRLHSRPREQREGFRQKAIARQNRDALAVDDMERRPAAAQRCRRPWPAGRRGSASRCE